MYYLNAKLICVFVFAYADCWFSHEAAQMFYSDHVTCLLSLNIEINVSLKIVDYVRS